MFAGKINPGQLGIVREILTSLTADFDTAVFCRQHWPTTMSSIIWTAPYTVTDNVGLDGIDTLANIERLQFADQPSTWSTA